MAFTSLTSVLLEDLIQDANNKLVNSHLLRSAKITEKKYLLSFGEFGLIISMDPSFPHIRIVGDYPLDRPTTDSYHDYVKLHVIKRRLLLSIEGNAAYGIINLNFEEDFSLIIELRGDKSNLILTENKIIIGSYRKENSSVRTINLEMKYFDPPKHRLPPGKRNYKDPNTRVEELATKAENNYLLERVRSNVQKTLRKKLSSLKNTINNVNKDLQLSQQSPMLKIKGEAILINLTQIPRGATEIHLPNPYSEEEILDINIPPEVTPQSIAAKFIRKATRLERAIPKIEERLSTLEAEKVELERIIQSLDEIDDIESLKKLAPEQVLLSTERRSKALIPGALSPRTFRISEGWTLLVGKGPKGNDHLSFSIARPDDIWLHARDAGGAHCVLQGPRPNSEPDMNTLYMAAQIAAYFSRSRTSGKAPVDYTRRKYVRKPSKAPAGLVLISREKTLMVEPKAPEASMKMETKSKYRSKS